MYPLLLCCFWMWLLILYHLPVWQETAYAAGRSLRKVFLAQRCGNRRHDRRLYQQLLEKQYQQRLGRGVSTIKVLAATAPLLGLFGTVTGMIRTFQAVAAYGLGNPRSLASGISEAMITTQFGLLIALPGIVAVYFMRRRGLRDHRTVEQMMADLNGTCQERSYDAKA